MATQKGLLGLSEQICMAERVSKCRAINSDSTRSYVHFRKAFDWATMGGARGKHCTQYTQAYCK